MKRACSQGAVNNAHNSLPRWVRANGCIMATMEANLDAAPLPEGVGALGAQSAPTAKIETGSFDQHGHDCDDFDDDDDFGHFAAATTVPVRVGGANHIPVKAVTQEVAAGMCDGTNGVLPPEVCSDEDRGGDDDTSQDATEATRQASEQSFSAETGDSAESSSTTGGVKREDSFEDFQQAQAMPFEAALATVDEGSDFADFEQAGEGLPVAVDGCDWGDSKGDDGFADFAAFGDASKTAVEDSEWADDGWNAFTGAEEGDGIVEATPAQPLRRDSIPGQLTSSGEGSFESLLQRAYALEGTPLSPDSGEGEDLVALGCCEAHVRLWEQLQDLDRAPSLKFSWNGSLSCQHLLQSLSIDSRNILRNPSVPLFASHLGLLEPQRGGGPSPSSEEPAAPPPPPAEAGTESTAIPPAQFDWTSSGLVNPLEQPAASTLLDLEFLSSLSSAAVSSGSPPTSSLEKEFLELGVSATTATAAPPSSAPSKLQELLRNNVSTLSSTRRRPSLLSSEAQAILDRLPDLSFMQARVLMFPVHLD
ncbi:aftiphilin isoform X2 [Amblyomma americanum]